MSVICYKPNKFKKIAISLKKYKANGVIYDYDVACFGHLFDYPDGWNRDDEILNYKIDIFVNDLYRSNQQTYLPQYKDEQFEIHSISGINLEKPYENKVNLYKALQSIRYNIYDNNGKVSNLNDCKHLLNKFIEYIADDIISAMPEYRVANVW